MVRIFRRLGVVPVVLLALLPLLAAACGSTPDGLEPGVWVAVSTTRRVFSDDPAPAPIRLLDIVSGKERFVGPAARYEVVAWSPDGSRLAALARGEQGVRVTDLYVWSANGKPVARIPLRSDEIVPDVSWSPDGSRIATAGARGITVYDRDGKQRGGADFATNLGSYGGGNMKRRWSPDSRLVAATSQGRILIADREGHGGEVQPPSGSPGGPALESINLVGWKGGGEILLHGALSIGSVLEVGGVVSPGAVAWRPPTTFDVAAALQASQARAQRLTGLVPGQAMFGEPSISAEGSTELQLLSGDPIPDRAPVTLLVERKGERSLVDLGRARGGGFGVAIDVVDRPGWKGPLPASR